jgi:S-adenosyl-L-methionine hydrolase (adenosine-forming)
MPDVPIITLTTDFDLTDWYVASLKSVLLGSLRQAQLVDITHAVPPGDLLSGSIVLERAIAVFPPATIHLAVVDPGVGSSRRILIARCHEQLIICPDNGLITWTARRHPPIETHELTWRPQKSSHTFHGRDIMAPAAAALASGGPLASLARPISDPILLDIALAAAGSTRGHIIYCDRFGNFLTNIPADLVAARPNLCIRAAGSDIGPLRQTYSDVPPGQPLALIGSSDLLEISVRDGSAASTLGLNVGDEIEMMEAPHK